jgi:parallel beta-helix repeat protein
MRKLFIIGVISLFIASTNCGSGGGSSSTSSGTSAVKITVGSAAVSSLAAEAVSKSATSAIPSGVTTVRVTVSAPDIGTIIEERSVAGQDAVTITIEIPNGPDRLIVVEALDASGTVLFAGEDLVDLVGLPVAITVEMIPTTITSPQLHVDVDIGSDDSNCTDPENPCKTITYTLTQAAEDKEIFIAAGLYRQESGETFPLVLKSGTMILNCLGENNTTVIGPSNGVPIISDNGTAITISDCVIDGDGLSPIGILLSADSSVSGNTIINNTVGVSIDGGSPVLTENSITDNEIGLSIAAGASPDINNENVLSCNTDSDLENRAINIDASNNLWDHSPPETEFEAGAQSCSRTGEDICDHIEEGGTFVDDSALAPDPCDED